MPGPPAGLPTQNARGQSAEPGSQPALADPASASSHEPASCARASASHASGGGQETDSLEVPHEGRSHGTWVVQPLNSAATQAAN